MSADSCPNCGGRVPEDARFCPDCGVRLPSDADVTAVDPVPPDEIGPVSVNVSQAAPRYFGVTPPMVVFALAVAALVLAIVVFALGHWIAGVVLLFAALFFALAFVAAARRLRETPVARASARALGAIRDHAGFAVEAVSAQSSARLELFRLRRELSELSMRRVEAARALGEAVYGGDEEAAARGRSEMGELDRALNEKEAEMTRVAAEANERVQRAQLQAQPTAIVEPPRVPEPSPVPSETPQPVTVPEPSPVPSEPPAPTPSPDPLPEPSPPSPETPDPNA